MVLLSKIITVGLQKGGVGKTTFAVNLAGITAFLLAKSGASVLLIDADPQASATSYFHPGAFPPELSLACLFDESDRWKIVTENKGIIHRTRYPNLSLAPSSILMAVAEAGNFEEAGRRFQYWIEGSANDYDFIVIDSPPSLGRLTSNCLMASDYVVIPTQPEPPAAEALPIYIRTISQVRNVNKRLSLLGIVVNMFQERQSGHKFYMKKFKEDFGEGVIGMIHRAALFTDLAHRQQLLVDVSKDTRPYREFRIVALEILRRMGVSLNGGD